MKLLRRVRIFCNWCGRPREFPQSIAKRKRFCSKQCHYDLMRALPKTCPECSARFQPYPATQKFCSARCADLANGNRLRSANAYTPEQKKIALDRRREKNRLYMREHRVQKGPYAKSCKQCLSDFVATRRDREFCSARCHQRFYRSKHPLRPTNPVYAVRERADLADCYVRGLLTNGTPLFAKDIPSQLVKLKRNQIRLLRAVRVNTT